MAADALEAVLYVELAGPHPAVQEIIRAELSQPTTQFAAYTHACTVVSQKLHAWLDGWWIGQLSYAPLQLTQRMQEGMYGHGRRVPMLGGLWLDG